MPTLNPSAGTISGVSVSEFVFNSGTDNLPITRIYYVVSTINENYSDIEAQRLIASGAALSFSVDTGGELFTTNAEMLRVFVCCVADLSATATNAAGSVTNAAGATMPPSGVINEIEDRVAQVQQSIIALDMGNTPGSTDTHLYIDIGASVGVGGRQRTITVLGGYD
tara:strand:- start:2958 stop:3458 length:501 start_codon:yes stop_codon:yes gene_type:complete